MMRINKEYDYPENLLRAINDNTSRHIFSEEEIKEIISDREKLATLEYVINSMIPEKESNIIKLYYKEKITFTEIANSLNKSIERVRQCNLKALRRLMHPITRKIIIMGIKEYYDSRINNITEVAEKERTNLIKDITAIKNAGFDNIVNTNYLKSEIFELDLPSKIINPLLKSGRSNIWMLYLSTEDEICKIRNFGKKSFDITNNKLEEICGFRFVNSDDFEDYKNRISLLKYLKIFDDKDEVEFLNKFNDKDKFRDKCSIFSVNNDLPKLRLNI